MTTKQKVPDAAIRVLRRAIRTKLGVTTKAAKKPAKREKVEDDEPAPRKQKADRLGYADI